METTFLEDPENAHLFKRQDEEKETPAKTIEHPKPVSKKRKQPIAVEKSREKRKKETEQVYTFTVYGIYIYETSVYTVLLGLLLH